MRLLGGNIFYFICFVAVKADITMDVRFILIVCSVTTVIDAAGKP